MPFPKLSIALLLIISPLVLSDERLIQQECHLTQTPQVCLQCCTTNPHTKTADAVGIAIIILGCIVDHASTLATSMSEMASKTTNKTMKITYQSCSVFFIDANKDLNTIIDKVKIGDYGMAEYILTRIDKGGDTRIEKQRKRTEGRDIDSCMDKNSSVKEVTSELARELLIAISDSLPDQLLNSKGAYENLNGFHGTVEAIEDKAEELRLKLISISNVPLLDSIALSAIGQSEGLTSTP
ncbi:hypothetical protein Ancab_015708 [Ancistrocladus abbreviatus]